MKDTKDTEEFLRAMARKRKRRQRQLNKAEMTPSKLPTDTWTKGARERLLSKVNRAEEHIDRLLHSLPCIYRRERPIAIEGKKYFVDFLVSSVTKPDRNKVRVAIEVDGAYHWNEEQRAKDRAKDNDLIRSSRIWKIIRIDADKAMDMSGDDLLSVIKGAPMGSINSVTNKGPSPTYSIR